MIELSNSFIVQARIDEAWRVLLDVERVAPCMPGARLEVVEDEAFNGSVRVKLGAMVMTYRGSLRIVETDVNAHRAVLEASGNESRGGGSARATVVMSLAPAASTGEGSTATEVTVHTSLHVTGKPAQFGRGVMVEVSERLIAQFADRLRGEISAPRSVTTGAPAAHQSVVGALRPPRAPHSSPEDESIDLLAVAGGALAKRAAIGVVAGAMLVTLAVMAWRSRGQSRCLLPRRVVIAVWIADVPDSVEGS